MNDKAEHKRLANIVKGVHASLRRKFKTSNGDFEKLWAEHCRDKSVLTEYAQAMRHLALDHWTKTPETRIHWCRATIHEYFFKDGLQKSIEKDERRLKHHVDIVEIKIEKTDTVKDISVTLEESEAEEDILDSACRMDSKNTITFPLRYKIRLLDVGSCFNPFLEFEEFLTVGLDLCPATQAVYQCDFLQLEVFKPVLCKTDHIDTHLSSLRDPIVSLPQDSFHVVVFSLLLEYLPSVHQRWVCCQKAHKLLMVNGLLIIITPDSQKQHRNVAMVKSWKGAIESMGFIRWRYVKQEHLHCMAFRKISGHLQTSCSLPHTADPDMLYISQDHHEIKIYEPSSPAENQEYFNELPKFVCENDV